MPPCKKVLLKKIERTEYLSDMIKNASNNDIGQPQAGWLVNENGFEIDYFDGNPFPENIMEIPLEQQKNDNGNNSDDEEWNYSSNDECDDTEETDDEWEPKK